MIPVPEVTDVEVAFNTTRYLPKMGDIPEEFKDQNRDNKWTNLFSEWFYRGFGEGEVEFNLKEGVDGTKMMRAVKAVMGSWDPTHEHKTAGVAYLMSEWIEDYKITRKTVPTTGKVL